MTTTVVALNERYDFYVGPPKKTASDAIVRAGSPFAAGYIRHQGAGDWRDVQAWRYFERMIRRLITDKDTRRLAKTMRGKRLAAHGDQGSRIASILAEIIDRSGILDNDDDRFWLAGFAKALDLEPGHQPSPPDGFADGLRAGIRYLSRRHEICGVDESFEDLGDNKHSGSV